jgi:hypothetical protein
MAIDYLGMAELVNNVDFAKLDWRLGTTEDKALASTHARPVASCSCVGGNNSPTAHREVLQCRVSVGPVPITVREDPPVQDLAGILGHEQRHVQNMIAVASRLVAETTPIENRLNSCQDCRTVRVTVQQVLQAVLGMLYDADSRHSLYEHPKAAVKYEPLAGSGFNPSLSVPTPPNPDWRNEHGGGVVKPQYEAFLRLNMANPVIAGMRPYVLGLEDIFK